MVDLSRREKAEKVLEVIPRDRWVRAAEIAAETGIGSIQVGALIRRNLLNKHVERKLTGSSWSRRYLYRRLPHRGAEA
jgi:hypothetical protein